MLVGPETRFGIPKGMWQFGPSTAIDYGLRLGPWRDDRRIDPSDLRHDPYRSSLAAAEFLDDVYATKAAASGLLVIASYNCSPAWIVEYLDKLPNDPRVRNFWNFYRKNWISAETKDFVLSVFSAALISETPSLFGFSHIQPVQLGE